MENINQQRLLVLQSLVQIAWSSDKNRDALLNIAQTYSEIITYCNRDYFNLLHGKAMFKNFLNMRSKFNNSETMSKKINASMSHLI